MRFLTLLALSAAILPALAQNFSEESVTDQSPDFNLVVCSKNKTLDGKLLGACHDGAAHEGMCIVDGSFNFSPSYVSWQLNTTRNICHEQNSTGNFTIPCNKWDDGSDPSLISGWLTWWLYYSNGGNDPLHRAPQTMKLVYYPWSNVVRPTIGFANYDGGWGSSVVFDKNGLLGIMQYQDDALEPGFEPLVHPVALYNWYICQTFWTGYHYTTLAWVTGGKPKNPTCVKVDIRRVWVKGTNENKIE